MRAHVLSFAVAMIALSGAACAQPAQPPSAETAAAQDTFTPEVGQAGKDVIWVPTQDALVAAMLKTAAVKPGELVTDLGSGDGRIAITAARDFGARAIGVEYNPKMVALSRANAQKEGVADKVEFIEGDIFKYDYSKTDVLTLYLLPELNLMLREDILKMRPGVRVVSNSFDMGDWPPDQTITTDSGTGFFWIVPAQVAGTWRAALPGGEKPVTLTIAQKYQTVSIGAARSGKPLVVEEPKLTGANLSFVLVDGAKRHRVAATANGETLTGTIAADGAQPAAFTAKRQSARVR